MDSSARPSWRWFLAGGLVALLIVALVAGFLAYQSPTLLLDWANLRYCG